MEEFLQFENQPWPPSLSQMGQLRGGQKVYLVKCLPNDFAQTTAVDAVILDRAIISPGHNYFWIFDDVTNNGIGVRHRGNSFISLIRALAIFIIQMLPPRTAETFEEYFHTVFAPYILGKLQAAKRLNLVWDVYLEDFMKRSMGKKRGSGKRRKVLPLTQIPSDWKGFLRVDDKCSYFFQPLKQ